jgi:hypothetical protein
MCGRGGIGKAGSESNATQYYPGTLRPLLEARMSSLLFSSISLLFLAPRFWNWEGLGLRACKGACCAMLPIYCVTLCAV